MLKATRNTKPTIKIFFTESSLARLLPHSIVYGQCYGRLNRLRFWLYKSLIFTPRAQILQIYPLPYIRTVRCRRQGQREVELGSRAQFDFGPDASAMGLDYVLDDGESEAGAT